MKKLKRTLKEFIDQANLKHNFKYDYSLLIYTGQHNKGIFICKIHGEFEQICKDHLNGHGCFKCRNSTPKLTLSQFIERALNTHGELYDYSDFVYISAHIKGKIKCIKHQFIFEQTPGNHIFGQGCPKCAQEYTNSRVSKAKRLTLEEFIEKSIDKHGEKFDYSKINYQGYLINVRLICKIHNIEFLYRPSNHFICPSGGCPKCVELLWGAHLRLTKEEFVEKANIVHNFIYTYEEFEYENNKKASWVRCSEHGLFKQQGSNHLKGQGCPKCCVNLFVSKQETIWLNQIGLPDDEEHRQVKLSKIRGKVDGFNPRTNTVYEYLGDYWHGNPEFYDPEEIHPISHKTYGELFQNWLNKEEKINSLGYFLVSVWESEMYPNTLKGLQNRRARRDAEKLIQNQIETEK